MSIKPVTFISFFLITLWLSLPLGGQGSPFPPLLATQEEVNQFFAAYVDRYTQKDIHDFFSSFSSEAVQNRKEGLEAMRTIYAQFFNQSLTLRYRIEEMKVEIYQNAVEVKARYAIHQALKKGGKEREWNGNIRWVLVKEDGALKIISLDYHHEKSP